MITFVLIVIALLFVLLPTFLSGTSILRSADNGLNSQTRWLWIAASFVLRLLISSGLLWLYFGGAVFDRLTPVLPTVKVTALVDTSSSLVTVAGDVPAYGEAVASRVQQVLEQLELEEAQVELVTFDEDVQKLGQGLSRLRRLNVSDVASNGQNVTRLREALSRLPSRFDGTGYSILLSDGWFGKSSEEAYDEGQIPPDFRRALIELGQPIIVLPLEPQEAWRYEYPEQPRLVDIGPASPKRFIAGAESERFLQFAVGPSSRSAKQTINADLALKVHGREELISQYACRDTEVRGVGRLTIPIDPGALIECLPLSTIANPEGAAAQATLTIGETLSEAKEILRSEEADVGLDRTIVQFLQRGYIPRLLVLDGADGESAIPSLIESSLNNLGWQWVRVTGQKWANAKFSGKPITLNDYDAVILADFPPGAFGLQPSDDPQNEWSATDRRQAIDDGLDQLATYVAQGGGLFISGGNESFGVGGYASTAIEPLLPVQLDPKGAAGDPPIIVVGIIDVSASLWYSKEARDRAVNYFLDSLDELPNGSKVRVLGYSDEPHELVPLQAFDGVEQLGMLLNEAFADLDAEFERRRLIGLQPEGLDVYGALKAGYRTFDRLDALEQQQSLLDSAVETPSFGTNEDIEKRLFLVMDAQDQDFLTFTNWTVDETETFVRTTAYDLAREQFKQKNVVLNAIGMTHGKGSLPDVRVIARSTNNKWRERYLLGQAMAIELDKLATAGGGNSYLDTFEIPLGALSRSMTTMAEGGIVLSPSPNHRFLPTEAVKQSDTSAAGSVAIAPAKRNARTILSSDYKPENGQAVRLGVWTEWVTEAHNIREVVSSRRTPKDELVVDSLDGGSNALLQAKINPQTPNNREATLSFGGAVSVLTTTLRQSKEGLPNFSDAQLHQVAFIRMLDWLVRTRAKDEYNFMAYRRISPEGKHDGIKMRLEISSAGEFAIDRVDAHLWKLEESDLQAVPSAELAEDQLPLDLEAHAHKSTQLTATLTSGSKSGGTRRLNWVDLEASGSELEMAMNENDAVLLDIELTGVDARGLERSLNYRLFVFPKKLKFGLEPASWMRGINQSFLQDIAALSGGAYFAPGAEITLKKPPLPSTRDVQKKQDFRWLVALLMLMAFIADFLIREYRIGRQE